MEERRAEPRNRVFRAGSIEFASSAVACTMRNLSLHRAGLEVVSPPGIPHEVTLNVVALHGRQHVASSGVGKRGSA